MSAVFPQKHLTDIAEWHRMGEAGIFPPESHMELIEGEILHIAPIGFNHPGHVTRLTHHFVQLLGDQALVRIQTPLQLGDLSEPEPDLALVMSIATTTPLATPTPLTYCSSSKLPTAPCALTALKNGAFTPVTPSPILDCQSYRHLPRGLSAATRRRLSRSCGTDSI